MNGKGDKKMNLDISIVNINVDAITFNGSLNIGKSLIVKDRKKKKGRRKGN